MTPEKHYQLVLDLKREKAPKQLVKFVKGLMPGQITYIKKDFNVGVLTVNFSVKHDEALSTIDITYTR